MIDTLQLKFILVKQLQYILKLLFSSFEFEFSFNMEWITVFILLGVFNSSLGLFNYEFKTKFYLNESRVIQAESSC